jgi:hypothetical protein
LLRVHEGNENDNGQMDAVVSLLIRLPIDRGCGVDFVHHTSKGLNEPGSSDRLRGASATRDGTRLLYNLTPMSKKEAKDFGVTEPQRRQLVRLDSAKVNLLPPATATTWFRLIDVVLGNGVEDYPDGDRVQTVECWQPPSEIRDPDPATLKLIFDQREAGLGPRRHYSLRPQVGDERAAWRVVQVHCPTLVRDQCRELLQRWLKAGWLRERPYFDPVIRKNRFGLIVVNRPLT